MLKNWKIKSFKSLGKETPLSLAKINVIAGANSSGKSSIIQTFLLLKQTLQYGPSNRALALNGPLLRLGTFDDVITSGSQDSELSIGFDFDFSSLSGAQHNIPWLQQLRRYGHSGEAGVLNAVQGDFTWGIRGERPLPSLPNRAISDRLAPKLVSARISTTRTSSGEAQPPSVISYSPTLNTLSDDDENVSRANYTFELDSRSRQELFASKHDASISAGYITHFLPQVIGVRSNVNAERAQELSEYICDVFPGPFYPVTEVDTVPQNVVSAINDWIKERNGAPIDENIPDTPSSVVRDAVQRFNPLRDDARGSKLEVERLSADFRDLQIKIQSMLNENFGADYETDYISTRSVRATNDFVEAFFKQGIRYLGPLRDNPRPVYQVEALESTTNVGYRGEHTAAVLDLNSARRVQYFPPPGAHEGTQGVRPKSATLHDAVVDWLVYLGVAQEVQTQDAGVYGNRLQVATEKSGKLHDLTNVGVGVSQLLPILVMALLAPRSSLLILEQPELHLHPKVQARLADFFISLAKSDKQTILETHSEYLVDRLRLRIAEANGADIKNFVNVIFTEKAGSETQIRSVEITEFGAVLNWPKDFFEQSQKDIARILTAASNKRRFSKKEKK